MTDDIARGDRARELLAEPLLIEAFELLESEYTDAWKESPAADSAARDRLWLMLKLLHRVRGHLEIAVTDGKLKRRHLDAIEEPSLLRRMF